MERRVTYTEANGKTRLPKVEQETRNSCSIFVEEESVKLSRFEEALSVYVVYELRTWTDTTQEAIFRSGFDTDIRVTMARQHKELNPFARGVNEDVPSGQGGKRGDPKAAGFQWGNLVLRIRGGSAEKPDANTIVENDYIPLGTRENVRFARACLFTLTFLWMIWVLQKNGWAQAFQNE